MPRKFASTTTVPISKSRGEVDTLLRHWGADAIQWTDQYNEGKVTLRFMWEYEAVQYMARFTISIEQPDPDDLLDGRTGLPSETKRKKALAQAGKQEHRVLLLWLKASLNAVDAGIVDAATIFLPFLEDGSGKTVAEIAVPHLANLPKSRATRLLGMGR